TSAVTDSHSRAVAPAWHTIFVLLALLVLSLETAHSRSLPLSASHGRTASYLVVMGFEWALTAFICYGLSRRGTRVADLVGGSWPGLRAIARDLGIAIAFLVVSQLVLTGVSRLVKAVPNEAIRNMLPRSNTEIAVFLLLTVTAGFCEEFIFRGYLQRQFTALTQTVVGGISLQAIAFGLGHGYQGWRWMVVITVFGALFGLLTQWRRSLRPGMLAHFVQDSVSGLLARHILH